MKPRIAILAATLLAGGATTAQQLHTSSLFELQSIFHNPAMAGNLSSNMVGISYRSQWAGISGSPKTATIFGSVDLPEHLIGLGGYLYNDQTGPTSRTGAQFSFAKHLPVSDKGHFSLGVEARFFQFAIDREKLTGLLGDPVLAGAGNRFKYDMGFGASYNTKRLNVGVSVSQLIQTKLDFYTGNLNTSATARLYRHYYLHGQYRLETSGGTAFVPNLLVVYLPNVSRTEWQAGMRIEREELWVGGGIRINQSYLLTAGYNLNRRLSIGYAFDNYTAPVSGFTSDGRAAGHELILRYTFAHKPSTRID